MKIIKDEDLEGLYIISLIHPSRESYVECRKIVNNKINKGYDSGNRDAKSCILFATEEEANYFATLFVNTSCPIKIRKIGKPNMELLTKSGLREYEVDRYCKCYLQNNTIKYDRKGNKLYEI